MKENRRCVIVGSADISDTGFVRSQISDDDYFVFCDAGLRHVDALCVTPSLIVGDFDSYKKPDSDIETIVLPREKDDTDTFFAVKEAIKRGFSDFLLLGVVGKRLDHTLGNLSILLYLFEHNCKGTIIDDYSVMEIVSEKELFIDDSYRYFSLMNIDGDVSSVNIKNAKYELDEASIKTTYQYALSNETIKGKTACVSVKNGRMLLIKIYNKNC